MSPCSPAVLAPLRTVILVDNLERRGQVDIVSNIDRLLQLRQLELDERLKTFDEAIGSGARGVVLQQLVQQREAEGLVLGERLQVAGAHTNTAATPRTDRRSAAECASAAPCVSL